MTTNWIPGIVTLGVGLAAGVAGLLIARKREPEVNEEAEVLQTRYEKLVEALRELSADKHLYDEATFTAQKTALETQAAEALRERDKAKKAPRKSAQPAPKPQGRPMLLGMLYGAGFVGLMWLLTTLITAESKQGGDPKYEALLVLSAISISVGDHEKILQFWEGYMNQPPPRRRPPMLQKAYDWLETAIEEK